MEHKRLFLQTSQGTPSPESLRKALIRTKGNKRYADAVMAEVELSIQQQRIDNEKRTRNQ